MDSGSISRRTEHVSVAYKDLIVVWGGQTAGDEYHFGQIVFPPQEVLIHQNGKWTVKDTTGDIPAHAHGATAQAIDGKMFLLCGSTTPFSQDPQTFTNDVYTLDLTTFTWQKMEPKGKKPCRSIRLTSWLKDDSIYLFGGYGPALKEGKKPEQVAYTSITSVEGFNNQLVLYNTKENAWVWPYLSGSIPRPRFGHASFLVGNKAYVFGGHVETGSVNEMFVLDLESFAWECVKPADGESYPCGRFLHLLHKVGNQALLYGGCNETGLLTDCWVMDVENIKWKRMLG